MRSGIAIGGKIGRTKRGTEPPLPFRGDAKKSPTPGGVGDSSRQDHKLTKHATDDLVTNICSGAFVGSGNGHVGSGAAGHVGAQCCARALSAERLQRQ